MVESALEVLYLEYKGIASSDMSCVRSFSNSNSLSKEKVQVYAICLWDVLARLKIMFPDKLFPQRGKLDVRG